MRSIEAVMRRKRRKNYAFNLITIKQQQQQQMQCEKCVWFNMINILLDIIYTCLHILRFSQMLSRLISVDFTNIFIVYKPSWLAHHFGWAFLHRKCDFVISLFRLTTACSWASFYQNIYSLIAFFRVENDKRLEESKSIREITVISKRKQQFCHWYCPGIRLQINQTKKKNDKWISRLWFMNYAECHNFFLFIRLREEAKMWKSN